MPRSSSKSKSNKFYYVLTAGLITGTLDAIAAIILNPNVPVAKIFRHIASGFFGPGAAGSDNTETVLWGIAFHYFIATLFSLMLLELYPKFRLLTKNALLIGIIYGFMIWLTMTYAVLPLTNLPKSPDPPHFDKMVALKNIIALIIAVGIPVAFISEKYYRKKALRSAQRRVRSSSV